MISLKKIINNKKGITLVEIIAASAIMALIGIVLLNFVFTTVKARDISRKRLEALAFITSYIDEEIRWTHNYVQGEKIITDDKGNKYILKITDINDGLVKIVVLSDIPNIDPIIVSTVQRR